MNKMSFWISVLCFLGYGFIASYSFADTLTTAKKTDQPSLPTVVVVSTGGTIAEKLDPKTGGVVPAVSGKELVQAVPGLANIAHIQVVNFSNIDSSQMSPRIWLRLSRLANSILNDPQVTGVVITHGTDTMDTAAYFLELTLHTHNKPVVLTGAMHSASSGFADGPFNILNAVYQVCSDHAKNWGVTVTLNQYINAAKDVVKTDTTNQQTFQSQGYGYLGYIVDGKVIRFRNIMPRTVFPLPKLLPKVVLIKTYAGDDGDLIRAAVNHGAAGLVVEAFGAGNVNVKTFRAIRYALSKKVPVVITSQVFEGGVYPMYGDQGGGASLEKAGAILCENRLPGQKARILLMLALAKEGNHPEKLISYFHNN